MQVDKNFDFSDLSKRLKYIKQLGVSHVYLSPVVQSYPNSTHGYDVIDHTKIDHSRGGYKNLVAFTRKAHNLGLGVVLDVVPNHMKIPNEAYLNPIFWDVLSNGSDSKYFRFFDFKNTTDTWKDFKVNLPFLRFARSSAEFYKSVKIMSVAQYKKHFLPDVPEHKYYISLLDSRDNILYIDGLVLPISKKSMSARAGTVYTTKNLSRKSINSILNKQYYNLFSVEFDGIESNVSFSYASACGRVINYRRFFDENSLIGLRIEDKKVFDHTHKLPFDLVKKGCIDCLRIDHPDGLANPEQYFERLNEAIGDRWITAEKILSKDEFLPRGWACSGTVGYDFMKYLNSYLVSKNVSSSPVKTDVYSSRLNSKYKIATETFLPEFLYLTESLQNILRYEFAGKGDSKNIDAVEGDAKDIDGKNIDAGEGDVKTGAKNGDAKETDAKHTQKVSVHVGDKNSALSLSGIKKESLLYALEFLAISFTRYRLYLPKYDAEQVKVLNKIKRECRKNIPVLSRISRDEFASVEEIIKAVDLIVNIISLKDKQRNGRIDNFITSFSQLTTCLTAKGIEDTFFYRYQDLLSLCEVGGDVQSAPIANSDFHDFIVKRNSVFPLSGNATTTHDTKRSEDVRAAIAALSSNPTLREKYFSLFCNMVKYIDCEDFSVCFLNSIFQTLFGVMFGTELQSNFIGVKRRTASNGDKTGGDSPCIDLMTADRLKEYFIKYFREQKISTSWVHPNKNFEHKCATFIDKIVSDAQIVNLFGKLHSLLFDAVRRNVLVSKFLVLSMPGVPDIYNGSETLYLSLVDPDNRRKIDFDNLEQIYKYCLDMHSKKSKKSKAYKKIASLNKYERLAYEKLYLTNKILSLRNAYDGCFDEDSLYEPIDTHDENVIGFMRGENKKYNFMFFAKRNYVVEAQSDESGGSARGKKPSAQSKNILEVKHASFDKYRNIFSGKIYKTSSGKCKIDSDELFENFPCAVLEGMNE